jgi:hypothetical protein
MKRNRSQAESSGPRRDCYVEIFNVKVPVSRPLALAVTSLLFLCAVVSGTATIVSAMKESTAPSVVVDAVQREQEEMLRHIADETPARRNELHPDTMTTVFLDTYSSDSCIVAVRVRGGQKTTRLLKNPRRMGSTPRASIELVAPNLTSAGIAMAKVCTGNCVSRHAGKYESWWTDKGNCWIKSWRRWDDGCEGFQWYNYCEGAWAGDFQWTCCVH